MEGHYHSIEELYEKDANFVYLLERGNHGELYAYRIVISAEQSKRNGAKPIEKRIASAKRHIIMLIIFAAPAVVPFFARNLTISKPLSITLGTWIFIVLCGIGMKYGEIEKMEENLESDISEKVGEQVLKQISEDSDEMLASKKEVLDQVLELEYGG